jgi:hypothetical protein
MAQHHDSFQITDFHLDRREQTTFVDRAIRPDLQLNRGASVAAAARASGRSPLAPASLSGDHIVIDPASEGSDGR